jgi:hypothetical protein
MFSFLTRLGHLAIGIPIVVAVATIFGFGVLDAVPVASHHSAAGSAATCTATASGVGSRLVITGTGYSANTKYLVDIKWPAGNISGQSTLTDASGNLNAWNYAYYAGNYSVAVMTIANHPTQVASCSTTAS